MLPELVSSFFFVRRFQEDISRMKKELKLPAGAAPEAVHEACRQGIPTWTGTEAA